MSLSVREQNYRRTVDMATEALSARVRKILARRPVEVP